MNEIDKKLLIKEIIDGVQYLKSRIYQSGIVRDIELLNNHPHMLYKNVKIIKDICAQLDIEWLDIYDEIDHSFVYELKSRNSKIIKSRFSNPLKTLFSLHYPSEFEPFGYQRNGSGFVKGFKISEFDRYRDAITYIYINSEHSSELYENTTRKYLKSTPDLFKCYTYWDEGIDTKYNLEDDFVNKCVVNNGVNDVRLLELIEKSNRYDLNGGLLLMGSIVKQVKYMRDNYVSENNDFAMILPSIHKIYYELVDHIDPNITKSEVIKMLNIISEVFGCRFIIIHKHKRVLNEELYTYKDCRILYVHMNIKGSGDGQVKHQE